MKRHRDSIDWQARLARHQQLYTGHALEKTISYLRNARQAGRGWGPYPKAETTLHDSALVIQALLSSQDKSAIGIASDAASHVRRAFGDQLQGLGFEDLCDLLMIVASEEKPGDDEFKGLLMVALENSYAVCSQTGMISVHGLCYALLSVSKTKTELQPSFSRWISQISGLQTASGAWPAVSGDLPSLIATTAAIRTLSVNEQKQTVDAVRRAVAFLQNELKEKG
jgi:hypothetical protein